MIDLKVRAHVVSRRFFSGVGGKKISFPWFRMKQFARSEEAIDSDDTELILCADLKAFDYVTQFLRLKEPARLCARAVRQGGRSVLIGSSSQLILS